MRRVGMSAAAAALLAVTAGMTGMPKAEGEQIRAQPTAGERMGAAAKAFDRLSRAVGATAQEMQVFGHAWRRSNRRQYPRKTPDWTNARYRRAALKKRNRKRSKR